VACITVNKNKREGVMKRNDYRKRKFPDDAARGNTGMGTAFYLRGSSGREKTGT
jgi:hypothetical protein